MAIIKFLLLTLLASLSVFVTVYAQMDTSPLAYGGNSEMREFICNEMNYPADALANKVEGTVVVSFTVMQDGKATNYHILEAVSPDLDREAMRICKLIMFYPAVKSGSNIIEKVNIPVKFNVKKYKRNCKQKGFDKYEKYSGPVDTSLVVFPTRVLDRSPVPVFPDPKMNFGKFIAENMKYPELAYTQNIAGEVELSFIVETSGRISNIEVINALGGGCSEEAIHLLKQVFWSPGVMKGKAVRTFLTASISFSLDNDSNHRYLPNNNNASM